MTHILENFSLPACLDIMFLNTKYVKLVQTL